MDELIPFGNDFMDLANPFENGIINCDDNFPVKYLSKTLSEKLSDADDLIAFVYKTVTKNSSQFAQTRKALKKGSRYIVDLTDDQKKDIESGVIKLAFEKGHFVAQIKNNNKYGEKLPIKKENFREGINPIQAANALQMKALAEQLEMVQNQLTEIDKNVRECLEGQQNDRIALYHVGMALFLEAQNVLDTDIRKNLLSEALKSLTESSFELSLKMQSDIKFLEKEEYKKSKGKQKELIDEKMTSINQSFSFIHQASMLRAAIYCDQNEFNAMATVINQYSNFIEHYVKEKAQLMIECDINDNGLEGSTWKKRANFKLDVSEIVKRLNSSEKVVYVIEEEKNNEDNQGMQ